MAYRAKGTQHKKRFTLERVQSFPPAERVASLVNISEKPELMPLSTPFEKMNFLKGVFSRAYEELHHLDLELARQASNYLMKEFAKSYSISSIAAQVSPAVSLLDQMKIPDWAERANSIASEYTDPMEAARKAALGDSSYYLDQHLAPSGWAVQAASGFPDSTIESMAHDLSVSEYARKATMGTSLNAASEAVRGLTNDYTSLLDDDLRESLTGQHASIQDAIAPQFADIPEPKNKLPPVDNSPFKYIDEQNARLREEQRKRDERQKQQAENSEALLKLHTEQIEENKKLQQEQRRESKFTRIMAVVALIVSIVGVGLTALGVFN